MMAFEAAFEAMRAAESIAKAHGCHVDSGRLDARNRQLVIVIHDVTCRTAGWVHIGVAALDACETPEQLVELVEREVAAALRSRQRASAS
jgi:hypothetical protein